MAVPLPLLWTTKYLSYDPTINPLIRHGYQGLSNDDDNNNISKDNTSTSSNSDCKPLPIHML